MNLGLLNQERGFFSCEQKLNFLIKNQLELLKLKKLMFHKLLIMSLEKVEIFTVPQIFLMKIEEE